MSDPVYSSPQPDILCFSSTDWEGIWGSRQQIMLRLVRRGHRVLFIERPVGLEHLWRYPHFRRRKYRRWREGLRPVVDNLWIVSLPPLPPGRYYSVMLNRLAQWLTVRWSRPYLTRLNIIHPILWIYHPGQGPLVGNFKERLSVYHCIDELAAGATGRKRQTITALEAELLQRVDLVFANSLPTYERKRRLHPHTYRVPSGADIEHFIKALEPTVAIHPDLSRIPSPRLGYSGYINDRLNYEVLEYLARKFVDYSLVFVGDTYPWSLEAPPLRRLQALPNVYFLGKYPFAQMPALLKGMDVCLLPYIDDERGHYRSPLKLYEYLAAGKPVVGLNHPEANEFADILYLASTAEDFGEQVRKALVEDTPERQQQRVAVARQHSWDKRVDTMEQIISRMSKDA